ncbi:MAG: hypothetical protein ABL876_11690 [Chitinophagaceae bacterium]
MKKNFFVLLLLLVSLLVQSQTIRKYPVGNSGCSSYMFCAAKFDMSKSQDSSVVYSGECINGDVGYGVICVKLLKPQNNLDMAEDLIIAYSDHLKESFDIVKSAGYGRGHHLNNNENTRGIIDYWEDKEQNHWKIQAWTDGRYIGFLYAYSKKELPEARINVFLNGFRIADR